MADGPPPSHAFMMYTFTWRFIKPLIVPTSRLLPFLVVSILPAVASLPPFPPDDSTPRSPLFPPFFPLPFLSLKVSQTPLYRALSLAIYFTLWAAYPKYRRLRALSSTRLLVCSWLGSSLRSRCMAWLSSVSVLEIVPKILVVLPPELTDNWTRGDRNLYLFLFLPSWRYLLKVYRKLLAGLMLSDRNWYQLFLT